MGQEKIDTNYQNYEWKRGITTIPIGVRDICKWTVRTNYRIQKKTPSKTQVTKLYQVSNKKRKLE